MIRLKPVWRIVLVLMAGLALSNATQPIRTYAVTSTVSATPTPQVLQCALGGTLAGAFSAALLGTRVGGPMGALVLGVLGGAVAGLVQALNCGLCGNIVTPAPSQYPSTVLDK